MPLWNLKKKFLEKKKHKYVDGTIDLKITGDDYGRNKEASEGIRQAYKKGYISHTSIMVDKIDKKPLENLPEGLSYGLHFNLLDFDRVEFASGEVPSSISNSSFASNKTFLYLSKEQKEVVRNEIIYQINKYKEFGYKCIYFDSHGHTHNKLPIAKIIIPILKEEGFTHARIPMNIKHDHLLFDLLYKSRVTRLYRRNFITTDYFCSCYDYIHIKNLNKYKGKTIEIMTHPYINKELGLVNRRDIDFEYLNK